MTKYGDSDNVKTDAKQVFDIIDRQGSSFMLDVVAEHAGTTALRFKLSDADRYTLIRKLTEEFKEALRERL